MFDSHPQDTEDGFPGLCRICGGTVPHLNDPASCTPTLCSERCLARALITYWAGHGVEAIVTLHDGYARLEGLGRRASGPAASAPRF